MKEKVGTKKSRITVDLTLQTLIELKATVVVFGAKSYASLIHQEIVQKIREAKQLVSDEEFDELCKQQAEDVSVKSEQKRSERQKKLDAIQIVEPEQEELAVKKTSKSSINKGKKNFSSANGKTYKFIDEDSPDEDND